ncbi:MAG: DUF5690 family protein, partial [Spirosomaceae bacterium]|nr:DUF5690 family protein [Spirosomataceae bacterium]
MTTAKSWYASALWAVVAAFGAYFCMYGFRRPYTAASFEGAAWGDLTLKTLLVTSQTLGYALSKWVGIKVVSEIKPHQRAWGILGLIGFAQLMLLGLGLVPRPWNFIFLFFNGLPLGMVFGLVQGYLEGRRATEFLMAGLCASFILADGVTKSLGTWLLGQQVSEDWMPFTAGLVFVLPLLLFVWMLTRIPPPNERDIAHRSERTPMTRQDRRQLFARYALGLVGLSMAYLLTTLLRSFRADFAPEIWKDLGFDRTPAIFTTSEVYVTLGVTLISSVMVLIHHNRRAFFTSLGLSISGFGLLLLASWGLGQGLDGYWFMVLVGLGVYVPYVQIHTTVFERLIAMTRDQGNIGYLMYLVDTVGYMGYVVLMFSKNQFTPESGYLAFYQNFLFVCCLLG